MDEGLVTITNLLKDGMRQTELEKTFTKNLLVSKRSVPFGESRKMAHPLLRSVIRLGLYARKGQNFTAPTTAVRIMGVL